MQIVYITSLDTRDRELFDIRPMSFIAKPISDSKIFKALETYLRLYTNTKFVPFLVPLTGLEPVRYRYRGILSPLCLPIPP